jgi:ankyrin repeat protein
MMNKRIAFLSIIIGTTVIPLYAKNQLYRSREKIQNTEIIQAAASNDLLLVRTLIIEKKADVNVQNKEGQCALHATSCSEIVFELMISGADPNLMTKKENQTPLMLALLNGHREKAITLLQCGANPNIISQKKTPLMLASEQNDYELVKELVKSGAKVSQQSIKHAKKHKNQAIASFLDHYRSAKYSKKNLNRLDKNGLSSIHYAVLHNNPLEFDALLCAGGKLNLQSVTGKTPIHLAVEHNMPEMVKNLLSLHVKIDMQDAYGKTPIHYAQQQDNQKIIALLHNDNYTQRSA